MKGQDRIIRNLGLYASRLSSVLGETVAAAGETVMTESQKLCPVATGTLRDSAMTAADVSETGICAEAGYAADYAPFVHERTDIRHTSGEAKFLETALKNYEPQYLRDLKLAASEVRV